MPSYRFNELCVGVQGSEAFPKPVDYGIYSLVSHPFASFWPEGFNYLFTADNPSRSIVKELKQSELEGGKGWSQFFPSNPNFTCAFVQFEKWLLRGEWGSCPGVYKEELESKGYSYFIAILQSVRGGYRDTIDESSILAAQIFQDKTFALACYTGMEA